MRNVKRDSIVAMDCTESQFIQFLKEPLEKLGVRIKGEFCSEVKSVIYYGGSLNHILPYVDEAEYKIAYDTINTFNPELFLALVAMTEGEDWDVGEWLYYKEFDGDGINLFKVRSLDGASSFLGRARNKHKDLYRKATVQELFDHLEQQKPIEKKFNKPKEEKMKEFKITREQLEKIYNVACSAWKRKIKELAEDIFSTFSNEGVLTEGKVKEMFDASNSEQKEVLISVFKDYCVDNNAFIKKMDTYALNNFSEEAFGKSHVIQINKHGGDFLCRPELRGKSFYVDSDFEVIVHKQPLYDGEKGCSIIEIVKR